MSVHNAEHDGGKLTGQQVLATAERKQNYIKISIVKLLKSISLISIINQGETFDTSCTFTRDKWGFDGSPAGCPALGCACGCLDVEVRLSRRGARWQLRANVVLWVGFQLSQGLAAHWAKPGQGFILSGPSARVWNCLMGCTHAESSPGWYLTGFEARLARIQQGYQ